MLRVASARRPILAQEAHRRDRSPSLRTVARSILDTVTAGSRRTDEPRVHRSWSVLPVLSRRRFLLSSPPAIGGLAVGLYTWRIEPHWVELTHAVMPVPGLPPELVGKTLVQLSDIHVGRWVQDEYLLAAFERVRALEPDLVVVTGDLISYRDDFAAHAERVYRHLPQGRLGSFASLGNHDYGRNWAELDVAGELQAVLERHGCRVLRNEVADVAGLHLIGLEDFWGPTFDHAPSLASVPAGAPAIALSHNPDTADLPGWENFQGWILAGHTHGGQCRPPFLPPPILPVRNKRYAAGVYGLDGGRRLYVNRGLGHILRVRFNVRPEIALFTLTDATA
jgi:uncharacterized protein